ncbi:MAG: hypothetical protein BWK76_11745 [Desulfobulbaceae bacterium A2]|nr:MAG: hypothetical protein BWK76_11745 [Desulfobulbaceae bacterium A2]
MNKKTCISLVAITLLVAAGEIATGNSIRYSKHDLSSSGGQAIKASGLDQVCIFCHTPHNARSDVPYLWNRSAQTSTYIPYTSTTMKAPAGQIGQAGQPTGASKLCLSCHDGTIALGAILTVGTSSWIPFSGASTLSGRSSSLGTDLSDDHPVSFDYQSSITGGNTELVPSSTIAPTSSSPVKLDSTGQLQCTACHDPHDNVYGKFLVKSNQGSALCMTCHTKSGWQSSSHATSTRTHTGSGVNPLPNATTTVAENACGNCHSPHTALRHQRLLKQVNEEDNCLACHGGQVATQSNIANELTKTYRHPVTDYLGVHDPHEDYATSVNKHVECEDCHNPHQVNITAAAAPTVSGKNKGVQGITAAGTKTTTAANLYEICYKCHADIPNNVIATPEITRQYPQLNTRLEFAPGNPSSHQVVENGSSGAAVPSLLAPYTNTSTLYCTDCHGSDSPTTGAHGPHGSSNKHLLVAKYNTLDSAENDASAYALCYKCHSQTHITANHSVPHSGGAFNHGRHIVENQTSCATCHDPHSSSGYTRLINFNTTVVTGARSYTSSPAKCVLVCHGVTHTGL